MTECIMMCWSRIDMTLELPRPLMPNTILVGGINCDVRDALPKVSCFSYLLYFTFSSSHVSAFSAGADLSHLSVFVCALAGSASLGVRRAWIYRVHSGFHDVRDASGDNFCLFRGF